MRFTVRQRSQKSEKAAAEKFGGRVQIASGALRHAKGDVLTSRFLIEDKITDKASYSLKKQLWLKIRTEAFNRQRMPMFRTTIQGVTLCTLAEEDLLILLSNSNE